MIRGLQRYYKPAQDWKAGGMERFPGNITSTFGCSFLVLVDAHRIKLSKTQNNLNGSHSAGRSETRCVFVSRSS